ncbi:MAG: D-alanine--D-alanine ligase family protein [Erysipelotrichaceae bacterium]
MKLKIGVIFGGESVEHEISIISANQAMNALNKDKYEVIPLYVSKNREIYTGDLLWDLKNYKDLVDLTKRLTRVILYQDNNRVVVSPIKKGFLSNKIINNVDVIIPVIHGTNGEDGTIQGFIEMLNVPYSGCNVIGASVGQDKVFMKQILMANGLPMTDWLWFYHQEFEDNKEIIVNRIEKEIGYPVIVKPANLGSSIGIAIGKDKDELVNAIEDAILYDRKILVEKVVDNLTEINCSVYGDYSKQKASVLEQVVKSDEILSFENKYGGNGSKGSKSKITGCKSKGMASTNRIVPANISEINTKLIQDLAIKTFRSLQTSGICRIDFLMDSVTNAIFVNEINTIPGSLAFYLWSEEGIDFSQLMDMLVQQAIETYRKKESLVLSYDSNVLANY